MDRNTLITHHRAALLRLMMLLSGLIQAQMPRGRYVLALRLMRPAESALRRLIVIVAQGLSAPKAQARPSPAMPDLAQGPHRKKVGCFPLFDPRLTPRPPAPPRITAQLRIRFFDEPPRPEPVTEKEAAIGTGALRYRLARFERALENLPREAKRLLRYQRRHPRDLRRPMRPGWPPGYCAAPLYEVDVILRQLHEISVGAAAQDTS